MRGGELHAADAIDGRRRMLITVSVMLASVIQALDTTIANVALPRIQGSLSATQDQMAWVLTSYIVAAAIMTPLSGWLAGQVGRKQVFLYSVAGFTLASMLCGMAQSLTQIVLARLMQGLCGAALVPLSQAVLLDINTPARHARAMSIWVMGITLGPIIGPALGGWLTENYAWRWVFYVNVPIGVLAFLGIASFLPKSPVRGSRFDFFGFTTLSLGVAGLQIMLDRGQLQDWFSSREIWIEATVAAVSFYLFVLHMLTTLKPPFVSPALFKDRNYVAGNAFIFIIGMVLFATLALLPPMLQDLLHYPVVTTGLVTAPRGVGTLLSMFIVSRIIGKVDGRGIIAVGMVLTAVSLGRMSRLDLQMDSSLVVWAGIVQGLGVGFVFVPLASASFATLPAALRNEGTAFFSLSRNIGSSIGISVVNTLLTRNTQILHASLSGQVNRYSAGIRAQLPAGVPSMQTLAGLNATVTEQAAMIAYNDDFKFMMLLCCLALPLVFLLRKGAVKAPPAALE